MDPNSIVWYINLLENSICYSQDDLVPFLKDLELLILHLIFCEEEKVFIKTCDLINSMFITLIQEFPRDLKYFDPSEY